MEMEMEMEGVPFVQGEVDGAVQATLPLQPINTLANTPASSFELISRCS